MGWPVCGSGNAPRFVPLKARAPILTLRITPPALTASGILMIESATQFSNAPAPSVTVADGTPL